ncbi:PhzF family phenazine biosynthesis protein [Corynebacterium nasicanis]|uniref:PhzF family phenazine biosynthesis protein n=1 Tax=Corynebacterium nasicanis TaxID=1448267 RepID=A0ABW1Q9I5_9CORY
MRFAQVDVFSASPYRGNPVAVLLDADHLSERRMQEIARWTNLSETTFVLAPTRPEADYRVRIFTPFGELPFAGHPTLGTAHAWREYEGIDKPTIIQECAAGLITVRVGAELAFAAPPTLRSGPLEPETLARVRAAIGSDILDHQWVDNGPGWAAVQLADPQAVRAVDPDWAVLGDLKLGLVGQYPDGDLEVRALFDGIEDPVTGSLNASVAQWFYRTGKIDRDYTATQGTGRVAVSRAGDQVWIGGATLTCFVGEAR